MPVLHVHTVELHMLEWTNADQNKNLNKNCAIIMCIQLPKIMHYLKFTCMPNLADYQEVSQIKHQFPGLPYVSPNLLVKIDFDLFCALVWNLTHLFLPKIQNILWSKVSFWDILHLFHQW